MHLSDLVNYSLFGGGFQAQNRMKIMCSPKIIVILFNCFIFRSLTFSRYIDLDAKIVKKDESDLIFENLPESNVDSPLFSDNSWSNQDASLFVDNAGIDIDAASLFSFSDGLTNLNEQTSSVDLANVPQGCLSSPFLLSPKRSRIRPRVDDTCDNPESSENTQTPPIATTQEQVEEYWCSTTRQISLGFGNIPVCDRAPGNKRPSELFLIPPVSERTGFQNLLICYRSKSMPGALSAHWLKDEKKKKNKCRFLF